MHPSRMLRCGIVLKPATLLHFHHVLTKRKYHLLLSSKRGGRPGPKGPAQELIDAVVAMKRRNPTWGCPRIAQQITLAFGVDIDKDVVRRISWKTLRARVRIWRSVLAHLSRSGGGHSAKGASAVSRAGIYCGWQVSPFGRFGRFLSLERAHFRWRGNQR